MTLEISESQLDEVEPLVDALFELSGGFVSKFGNFLPHGASLDSNGQVALYAAAPENEKTDATEVLPLLHDGLRTRTADWSTRAVAVGESVFIGENMTPAIKILVEHREGLTLALYRPWKKRLLRKPAFGDIQISAAEPEVGQWRAPVL